MHGSIPGLTHVIDESTSVAGICANGLGAGNFLEDLVCKFAPSSSIGSVGRMNMNTPNISLRIHGNLTASAFYLFAAMKANRISLRVGFDALRVHDQVAWTIASPFFSRRA